MTNKKISNLFESYDNLISIGYNCFFKRFLKIKLGHNKETYFFDYIGTSMWSINELIKNDFDDFFNHNHYKKIEINTTKICNHLTNTKYYVRFPHDLELDKFNGDYNSKYFIDFINSYTRKKNRFYELLNSNNKIIFLRLEEDNTNRIIYPEYKDKVKINEYDDLKNFTEIIKNKFPNLNFIVIFISKTSETNIDEVNNTIILNSGNLMINEWKISHHEIEKILLSNYELVENFLKKIFS